MVFPSGESLVPFEKTTPPKGLPWRSAPCGSSSPPESAGSKPIPGLLMNPVTWMYADVFIHWRPVIALAGMRRVPW
jgi:hypothetical protein